MWLSDLPLLVTDLLAGGGGGPTLVSIEVIPNAKTQALNAGTVQYTALGTYDDASVVDITTSVTWASTSPSIASIGASTGLATPLAVGSTIISATLGAISDNALLTVVDAVPDAIGSTEWSMVIEGYPTIFVTGDPDNTSTIWEGTDWEGMDTPALGGLFLDLEVAQELDLREPIVGSSGSARVWIQPDATDQFGKDVGRSNSGATTYMTVGTDRNDPNISVESTATFDTAPAYINIGNERSLYSALAASTFTVDADDRGMFVPFGCSGTGAQPRRWAHHHRVGNVDYGVPLNPLVTQEHRTWRGRWVGIFLHEKSSGLVTGPIEDAEVAWAGRIVDIADTTTGHAAVQLEHVLDVVKNSMLMRDPFAARMQEGVFLKASDEFFIRDEIQATGTVKTSNAISYSAGYYTVDQLCTMLTDSFAAETAATRLSGTYNFGVANTPDGWRLNVHWRIPYGAGNSDVKWRLHLPKYVSYLFGVVEQGSPGGGLSDWASDNIAGHDDQDYDFYSREEPWRLMARLTDASDIRLGLKETRGTFIDQEALLPPGAQVHSVEYPGLEWGIFILDGGVTMVAAVDDADAPTELLHAYAMLDPSGTHAPHFNQIIGRRYSDYSEVEIRQVLMLHGPHALVTKSLFYSTGTEGYNGTFDILIGNGLGIGIPADLLGTDFDNSVDALPGADDPITVVIEKPMRFADVMKGDLFVRGGHLVFKDGRLKFVTWSTPTTAQATVTLSEDDKAEPAENNAPDHRAVSMLTSKWAAPIIKLEYNRSLSSGTYRDTYTIEDRTAVDDADGAGQPLTYPLPNVYSEFVAAGAGIAELAPGLAERMALITRPIRIFKRSMDMSKWFGTTPGDIALVSDDFARDPVTGERGIGTRPALVIATSWNPGGPMAGATEGRVAPMTGEVTVAFLEVERVSVYSPCAQVDDGAANAGYNAGTKVLTCEAHEHSESTDTADATQFVIGDKITVVEIDPDDPAAPQSWNDTVAAQSGNTITMTTGLAGFDTTGATLYRVISRTYSVAVATQQVDVYQADDADGRIEDTAGPYLYGIQSFDGAATQPAHTDLPEFHATLAYGDGKPRDTGYERGLIRMVENLIDHKTAIQSPFLEATARSPLTATGSQYELHSISPCFVNASSLPHGMDRFHYVAPTIRSTDGASASVRVTLCSQPPVADSLIDVPMLGSFDQATFTTTSTTMSIPAELGLDVRCAREDGLAFIVIEFTQKAETRGLAEDIARERE